MSKGYSCIAPEEPKVCINCGQTELVPGTFQVCRSCGQIECPDCIVKMPGSDGFCRTCIAYVYDDGNSDKHSDYYNQDPIEED